MFDSTPHKFKDSNFLILAEDILIFIMKSIVFI